MGVALIETHERHFTSGEELLEHYRDLRARMRPVVSIFGRPVVRENVPRHMLGLNGPSGEATAASAPSRPEARLTGVEAVYAARRLPADGERPRLMLADIVEITCLYYGLDREELLDKKRQERVVPLRHVALLLAARLTTRCIEAIAEYIGNRHHSVVHFAYRSLRDKEKLDAVFREDVVILTSLLYEFFDIAPSGRCGAKHADTVI